MWSQIESLNRVLSQHHIDSIADFLGIIGFFGSLIGFAITIYSVLKAKSAAEAAKAAVSSTLENISKISIASDFGAILRLIEEIRTIQRSHTWDKLPDKYVEIRRRLITARHPIKEILNELSDELETVIESIRQLESEIERYIRKPPKDNGDPKRVNDQFRVQADRIQNMHAIILRKAGNQ